MSEAAPKIEDSETQAPAPKPRSRKRAASAAITEAPAVNAIEPVNGAGLTAATASGWLKKRAEGVEIADDQYPDQKPLPTGDEKQLIPPAIEAAYIKVGNSYHYEAKPNVQAFRDLGARLETDTNSRKVAGDLVAIADSRGWTDLKLTGTEEFKREVWLEASLRGIEVRGFKPTEADRALLIKRERDRGTPEQDLAKATGQDAGAASAALQKPSESAAKLRAVQSAPVQQSALEKAAETTVETAVATQSSRVPTGQQVVSDVLLSALATRQEKAAAFRDLDPKAGTAKFPDLAGSYAIVHAAEDLANSTLRPDEGRKEFVAAVRETLASKIEKGMTPPQVERIERVLEQDHDRGR